MATELVGYLFKEVGVDFKGVLRMKKLTVNELALYLGCEVEVQFKDMCDNNKLVKEKRNLNTLTLTYFDLYELFKPILRPLSDITEEEAIEVLKICLPYAELLEVSEDFERFQKDDEEARIYYWHESQTIDEGTTYTEEALTISFDTCDVYSHWGHTNNFHSITAFLLTKHFDLFNWIEQGLAIKAAA